MLRIWKVFAVIVLSIGCAACTGAKASPSVAVTEGDILLQEDFEDIETSSFPSYGLGEDLVFGVTDGSYAAIVTGSGYVWTLNNITHDNVVISATVEKVSNNDADTYGIICRAHSSNNGMGYYFLISASGNFGIRKGDGERIRVLVPWTKSKAIRTGNKVNTLKAVCVDDYLALYINDQFVAETRDSQYVEGFAGVAVATEDRHRIAIRYNDMMIRSATITDE